eukprot:gene14381-19292_t
MDDTENLPDDVTRLKLLVLDLNRRLENAQHTIEAERKISQYHAKSAEYYYRRLSKITNQLKLELVKTSHLEKRNIIEIESRNYDATKLQSNKLHDELRYAELDHSMSRTRKEPLKLSKMRTKLDKIEKELTSQKLLLQQYSELESMNEELSDAAQANDIIKCHQLIRCGASINYIDSSNFMPIHYACRNGNFDIVKLLLELGADHSSYLTGASCIVIASTYGHLNVIKLLVEFGANVEDKGKNGTPATICALINGHLECLDYLLTNCEANINSTDVEENTLLHNSIKIKDPNRLSDMISYLLSKGISTELVNLKGLTALQSALYSKCKVAIDVLRSEAKVDGSVIESLSKNSMQRDKTENIAPNFEIDNNLIDDKKMYFEKNVPSNLVSSQVKEEIDYKSARENNNLDNNSVDSSVTFDSSRFR